MCKISNIGQSKIFNKDVFKFKQSGEFYLASCKIDAMSKSRNSIVFFNAMQCVGKFEMPPFRATASPAVKVALRQVWP